MVGSSPRKSSLPLAAMQRAYHRSVPSTPSGSISDRARIGGLLLSLLTTANHRFIVAVAREVSTAPTNEYPLSN